jgi:hypothetical protein
MGVLFEFVIIGDPIQFIVGASRKSVQGQIDEGDNFSHKASPLEGENTPNRCVMNGPFSPRQQ